MVNCNPETVSTDYDTSDRLYFEPLTLEDVLNIVERSSRAASSSSSAGRRRSSWPCRCEQAGVPILGTSPDAIDRAEDRQRFAALLDELGLAAGARRHRALARGGRDASPPAIGYPVLVRPVLRAGRARHADRLRRARTSRSYMTRGGAGEPGASHPRRQVPRGRPRDRRGRRRRRRARGGGRGHGAHREGRRALRRRRLRAAALLARRRPGASASRAQTRALARGARRGRAHQHAVRDPQRADLRARGEPARLPHGAVRLQGHRRAAGQARHPGDARARRWRSSASSRSARSSTSR